MQNTNSFRKENLNETKKKKYEKNNENCNKKAKTKTLNYENDSVR